MLAMGRHCTTDQHHPIMDTSSTSVGYLQAGIFVVLINIRRSF
ncbi:unnamed protein product [Larinioides sclopetarius]|uniref:Uncharacterized protein n=1 Tax=Larinioides sclopetarius TaxID=280406 RepID=A0AAV2BG99_9ARAC